ncbi:hypothetical protein ASZ90_011372 [hydrocarbon metagenome]|uniref:NodB homology domain-containing protein n=1 Tax=hydrocarbon metagenome TaxID=938273 RepID=A0A0W8FDV2_9ZZZZ
MITIAAPPEDAYRLAGIRHFIETSGIPATLNQHGDLPTCIRFGNGMGADFLIRIAARDEQGRIAGQVRAFGSEAPVFEIPDNTGDGDEIQGYFEGSGESNPCITLSRNTITIGFDIFREIGFLLSGYMESIWSDLSEIEKKRIAATPILDIYEEILFKTILLGCRQIGIPLVRKSYWPDGKRFAVCLTHDVDELKKTYQWITRPIKSLKKGDIEGVKNQFASFSQKIKGIEPYWTFEEIIRINKHYGITSTFFFLKESARTEILSPETWHHCARCRDLSSPETIALMRKLAAEGNEVGLHGSFYSYNNPELLRSEKEELERVSGGPVEGIRQHHLNLDIPATWQHQEDVGLLYDTSLGFKDRPGFRFGTCFPFHPVANGSPLKLFEIPLAIMDITLHGRSDRWDECSRIIDAVESHQGVLTLLWHPPVFNALEYPEDAEMYEKILTDCRQKSAWIAGAGEIARWWRSRETGRLIYTRENDLLKIVLDGGDPRQEIEVYLPEDTAITILSGNADILDEMNGRVRIRMHEHSRQKEILLRTG